MKQLHEIVSLDSGGEALPTVLTIRIRWGLELTLELGFELTFEPHRIPCNHLSTHPFQFETKRSANRLREFETDQRSLTQSVKPE